MTNQTDRSPAETKVAELLQLLDQAQANANDNATPVAPASARPAEPPAAPAVHEDAPRRTGPATWMMESPEVETSLALRRFATLHPSCRGEVLEHFRSLRTRVFLERKAWFDQGSDLRALAVVSPVSHSGKSLVAANLAAVLAATGDNRVLLVDANPASPALGAQLGLASHSGFCEVLQGDPWYHHLHRVPPASLFVMPFGSARASSVDTFDYTAMPVWLHSLRASFDWVIFDGPSFENPSDAQLLTNFADASLLVVRKEEAHYSGVQEALRCIPRERLLGAVVMPPS